MSNNTNLTFNLFPWLPLELQDIIWSFAASCAIQSIACTPEVCLTTPLIFDAPDGDFVPSLPFTVDTSWPQIAHACRNSRAVLFRSHFTLRHHSRAPSPLTCESDNGQLVQASKENQMLVPYRLFNPQIDTLYWGHFQNDAMATFFANDQSKTNGRRHMGTNMRCLAVDISMSRGSIEELVELLGRDAPFVPHLTLILPAGALSSNGQISLLYPDPWHATPPYNTSRKIKLVPTQDSLLDFLHSTKERMVRYLSRWDYITPDPPFTLTDPTEPVSARAVLNDATRRFDGLQIQVGVFEEWAVSNTGEKGWVGAKSPYRTGRTGRAKTTTKVSDTSLSLIGGILSSIGFLSMKVGIRLRKLPSQDITQAIVNVVPIKDRGWVT
ncbi:hypothetical protein V8F33_009071 [Rhypophila sp. PSN 637]